MASFPHDESGWSRLDYKLARDGGIAFYHSETVLQDDLAWLRSEKYQVHEFDARKWKSTEGFHSDVASKLQFPEHYGRNLSAFEDCMRDVEVPQEGGTAIVIRNVEAVEDKQLMTDLLEILAGTMRSNLLFGRRFLTLLQSGNRSIVFPAVGALPVQWNPKEWPESKRGV
ncbi:MAG TPA: barstar family protein [Planctomycetota bacterium]|nr:barstar family protein [Planctomycetota bacterium]